MDFKVFENYEVDGQISLFDFTHEAFKIDKPIRLIESKRLIALDELQKLISKVLSGAA